MTWNSNYYVYMITNLSNKVLYIGVTNDLKRRIYEHKNGAINGFTKKYNVYKLIYFEHFTNIEHAIKKEKQLKKWKRLWKNELVESKNPKWADLYNEI
ncbi:MAG: GIY-YIG nuclease family protein [Bacteroidales bacterium]|nr:GIY-YIG nuclease family protein [Bacteroidales bacterium]